jgi:hypothetical protein
MPDPLAVSPTQLNRDAAGFGQIGELAVDIGNEMVNGIYELPENWYGDNDHDQVYVAFKGQFPPNIKSLSEFIGGVGTGMGLTGSNIQFSAARYTATDADNADSIPHIYG